MRFVELTEPEFREFSEKHSLASFVQSPEIAELRERKGWRKHFVGVKKGAEVVAGAMMVSKPCRFRKRDFYSPHGPLIDFSDEKLLKFFFTELKKYLKKHGAYVLRFDPYLADKKVAEDLKKLGMKPGKTEEPRWICVLPLRDENGKQKTLEEVKKGFRANTRNIINKTLKSGIKVKKLAKSELPRFKAMTEKTAARRGFNDKPLEYYEAMYDLFGKNVEFLMAELDLTDYEKRLNSERKILGKLLNELEKDKTENAGRIKETKITLESLAKKLKKAEEIRKKSGREKIDLSCAMFLTTKREITYLFSGNDETYMYLDAQYLIQWEVIQHAVKEKHERYNFYGISGIFEKSDPSYGVYEFKKGFGGEPLELIGGFELPVGSVYRLRKIASHFA